MLCMFWYKFENNKPELWRLYEPIFVLHISYRRDIYLDIRDWMYSNLSLRHIMF